MLTPGCGNCQQELNQLMCGLQWSESASEAGESDD